MLRVGHRLKIVLVAIGATDILGWAGPLTLQAQWIPASLLGPQASLEQDFVFSAVAEVVFVVEMEAFSVLGDDLAHLRAERVDRWCFIFKALA